MIALRRLRDPSLRRIRFEPRQEMTHLAVALMEALWILPWFALLVPGTRGTSFPVLVAYVGGNILAAMWLVRALDGWGMWVRLRRALFLFGLLLAVLWTAGVLFPLTPLAPVAVSSGLRLIEPLLPPLAVILILVGILWWRGLRLALVNPTPTRVAFGMRFGILAFFAVAALSGEGQTVVISALPLFFFFGLLATSLARATSLRAIWRQPVAFGSRWTLFMALAAITITLVGFLIAALLSGMDPEQVAQVVGAILTVPVLIALVLMTPVLLLLQVVAEALAALVRESGLGNLMEGQGADIAEQLEQGPPPEPNPLLQLLQELQRLIDAIGGLGVCLTVLVVLVVVAVILLTVWRRQQAYHLEGEERESLESDALGGLRAMLRRGLDALNNALSAVGQFGLGRDLFAALTVRRVYAQMAALAARRGFPRAPSETPYEYRETLRDAYPGMRGEVVLITEAYVRVRYGEVPETAEALQAVVDAWERLKIAETAAA